jgi:ferredoxin
MVRLARSGLEIRVGEHESMLEAIEAAGVEPDYLCRGGVCGQCETAIVACDGVVEHNDHYLSEDERSAGKKVMICMSRFRGRELVLDL